MKFMLVAAALNLQVVYPDQATCDLALSTVSKQDQEAFCIPAGKDKSDEMFDRFLGLIKHVQEMENGKQ